MTGCPWNESKWPLVTRLLGLPLVGRLLEGDTEPPDPHRAKCRSGPGRLASEPRPLLLAGLALLEDQGLLSTGSDAAHRTEGPPAPAWRVCR
jgi:hypothetical protein